MGKSVYIAEKPSVAQEFAKALHVNFTRKDGYLEGGDHIVTWCVGHLVTMSYPDAYDPNLKRWSFDTLPFIPKEFKYEVIPAVAKQFNIVKDILTRDDVEYIYVCTDSGREGEYIYRLVRQEAGVKGKKERRVWIDSQTEEEILKGINTAKDISEYDNLSDSAYLRAKEDYLMGINFSRVLTLKYGRNIANYLHLDRAVVSVGRVMTCVLGMVVRREREIRSFVKTPFYRVIGQAQAENSTFDAEWRVSDKSMYAGTPYLYKDNGFKDREKANWKGLSFETLDAIQQKTGIMPLVLHGGTGIPADMIKKAITLGVSKINVNTECQLSFQEATRKYIEAGKDLEGKGFDPRKLLAPGAEAIKATVKEKMELFGSVGKA